MVTACQPKAPDSSKEVVDATDAVDATEAEKQEKAEEEPGDEAEKEAAAESENGSFKFSKPITLIIPFGEGSDSDTTARAWITFMEENLGTEIEIKNVAGQSGVLGAEALKEAPADGYTFAMFTPSLTLAAINKTTSYDLMEEIVPVALLVKDYNIVTAKFDNPNDSIEDFAKASKDEALKSA